MPTPRIEKSPYKTRKPCPPKLRNRDALRRVQIDYANAEPSTISGYLDEYRAKQAAQTTPSPLVTAQARAVRMARRNRKGRNSAGLLVRLRGVEGE